MDYDTLLHWFRTPRPLVTVLRLYGIIGRGGALRHGMTLAALAADIDRAFEPRHLSAVALAISSPGGAPVQSSLIAGRIRQRAAERKVPVLAFVEDVAASGGYWLACAADEIFVDESSVVGSIGVVSAGFGLHELIARHGIERRVHTEGKHKSLLDPFRPEEPEDVARLKALQGDIFTAFKAQVRGRRGPRLTAGEEDLFTGDIWAGRRAVELGLADGIGELRGTCRARFGDKMRLRVINGERRGWLRRRLGLDSLAAESLAAIEERLAWGRYGL
ncbi:MAG: S49 family peptidase [Rhodospirillales bacterium]|nr:S49 family peptidase [Rhodospirillales bacterium]